jgi:hypothetical protein
VHAFQGKVRETVIEGGAIQSHDIRGSPAMLRMAGLTLARSRATYVAVKSRAAGDIRGDVLVTVQTQRGLPIPVRPVVTRCALLLNLGVRLADRPRHQELLKPRASSRCCETKCQQRSHEYPYKAPVRWHRMHGDQ